MTESIKTLIELGYSKKDAEEIIKAYPLTNLKDETLKENIKTNYKLLMNLGYTNEEVIKMTKMLPALYSYSEDNITNKIDFLIDLGYSKQEVLKMTINFPALYSFSEENIIEKIEYYRKKNLDFIIIENTKYLMQSMKKTKARYNYLTEEKMFSLDESNYSKLFMSEKNFQKTYGVSTDALIKLHGLDSQIKRCIKK